MTTPSATTRLRFVPDRIRAGAGFILGFGATLLLGLLLLVGASTGVALANANRIMPGVSVSGVELGGLDRAAAAQRLSDELPSLAAGNLVMEIAGQTVSVPLSDLERHYDIEATLDMAFGIARSGSFMADEIDRLRTLTGPTVAGQAMIVEDHDAIERMVTRLAGDYDREARNASVRHAGPAYVAVPAVTGLTVDRDALRNALEQLLSVAKPNSDLEALVTRQDPAIGTTDAEVAAASASAVTAEPLVLRGAGYRQSLTRDQLGSLITFGETDSGWGMTIDQTAVEKLLKPIRGTVARAPQNASFAWGASGISGVVPAQVGRRLKLDESAANLVSALQRRTIGATVPTATLAVGVAQPSLGTDAARSAIPRMQRISTWTTYYVPGEGNFWGANISIPAHDLDGLTLAPGEWFDFWRDIGPVTAARGYGYGGAIIGGRSVANGALAGGICATSTTLFNAAMRGGLEIGDKTNHYYYIDRYPMGLDATVFQTDSYEVNMTFRNDTPNPVVIRAYTGTGFVRFDIWGVPSGRTVTLSTPVQTNYRTARETTVFNPNLAPGTAIRREYMHDGFDTSVTRWVRDADGNLIHQDTWYSHYSVVNGITEVGPRKASS
jgi:vancomycin resistance protein YoaR